MNYEEERNKNLALSVKLLKAILNKEPDYSEILKRLDILIKLQGARLLIDNSLAEAITCLNNLGISKTYICFILCISNDEFESEKNAAKQLGRKWRD